MLILLLVIDQLGVWGQQPGFKTGSAPLSLVVILSYFTSQCLSFFTYIMDTSSRRCLGWCLEDGKRLISWWLFITIVVTISICIISKERGGLAARPQIADPHKEQPRGLAEDRRTGKLQVAPDAGPVTFQCSEGKESDCNAGNPGSMGQEDPLEKGMATHSSTLAWRIPWTEEPGELQFMGLQRFRND